MAILNVYLGDHTIKTTVTSYGDVVFNWINTILNIHRNRLDSLLVGVDVKWCPDGTHGTIGKNPIATLQLCVGHCCLVFKLIHRDNIPDNLRQFLASDRYRFVGVRIRDAAVRLQRNYSLRLRNVQDLRDIAASRIDWPEMRNFGLRKLAWVVTGLRTKTTMSVRISNWGAERLYREQIVCAAVDAFLTFFVCLKLELNY